LRPSQREGPGLISGETRPQDRLRPCRSAPADVFRPPPASAGATSFSQTSPVTPRTDPVTPRTDSVSPRVPTCVLDVPPTRHLASGERTLCPPEYLLAYSMCHRPVIWRQANGLCVPPSTYLRTRCATDPGPRALGDCYRCTQRPSAVSGEMHIATTIRRQLGPSRR
jgi:hypothetical protein